MAKGKENRLYNASKMSDGERVIFYLAGSILAVPNNSIIIIDELEMHTHPSLIKSFFDLIEIERTDCSFIYLTHNIDFAFSRQDAQKNWIKELDGTQWDYEILQNDSEIPEQIYYEILGSRKPVLFIEGGKSSLDYQIFQQVFNQKGMIANSKITNLLGLNNPDVYKKLVINLLKKGNENIKTAIKNQRL